MGVMEVRAFGKLYFLFRERDWPVPLIYKMESEAMTAAELRDKLEIPSEDVEAVFINRLIRPLSTKLKPGDRIAFVPHGIPSIHRFNLGFYAAKQGEEGSSVCRDENRDDEQDRPAGGNGDNGGRKDSSTGVELIN